MKNAWLFIVWGFLFYSCKEVSFPSPQPAGVPALKEIPTDLRGRYTTEENNEKSDTLIIESWGYHFKDSHDKDWLGRGTLSDSMVVKFYKDYYFVNFRSGSHWVLRLLKKNENGNFSFQAIDLDDEVKGKDILKKLSRKFKVTEVKMKDQTFYQINPSRDELMLLIKEGFFTGAELKKLKK